MNKLRLQLEELAVESFDTTRVVRQKGTVVGQQCTCHTNCSCPGLATCDYTCDDPTCVGQYTCGDDTCGGDSVCYCPTNACPTEYDTCRPRLCGTTTVP